MDNKKRNRNTTFWKDGKRYKKCSKCLEIKLTTAYHKNGSSLAGQCKCCQQIRDRNYNKTHKHKRNWYLKFRKNWHRVLFNCAKSRAKKKNLPFNLELSDIIIPEFCPVLGIKLEKSNNYVKDCSPTIDRLNNNLGYVKGNICVMSYRANCIKNCGTADEHRKIADWIEKQLTFKN